MRVLADQITSSRRRWWPLLALLLCLACGLAQAQSADTDAGAPPDRVARLSYIAGDLGFLPAGAQDWTSADINRPLTTGDRLSTGQGARAELELGGGVLRMDGSTDFGMLNLNDNLAQVELTQGTLNLSVRHLDQGQSYEIDTPTLALVVSHPGTFRVDVDNGGNGTRVTVFSGQAVVYGENNAQRNVFEGQSYQFDDATLAALNVNRIGGGDAFDAWCSERDSRYAQSQATRYVSQDMVGYQDLDQYGNWQTSPEYGAVWYPNQLPAGWAPYRDGHWAFIAPWGWTWVDDSPWGFAPYHYGRWAYIGGTWGWIPGPIVARPVYAPALVAFVGGGGWSIGISAAPVGWFPLGPGEIYNPWYHCDRAYYRRVNVTNIYVHNTYNRTTIINNINNQYNDYRNGRLPHNLHYANRTAPRGFSAMPGNAFANGQRVQRDLLRVNAQHVAAAPVLAHGVSDMRPDLRSLAPPRNPRARPLPVADFRRNVVARTPPPTSLPTVRSPLIEHVFEPAPTTRPHPFNNVRVLDSARTATPIPQAPRPGMTRENVTAPRAPMAGNPRPTTMEAPSPIREREQAPQREPMQAGALPSSRFARPNRGTRELPAVEPIRRAPQGVTQQAPRPGVSYIAGPQENRPQPTEHSEHPVGTLPQPPRFERNPTAEPQREPVYQPQREPAYRQPPTETMREQTPQRYQQAPQRFGDEPRPQIYQAPRNENQQPYQPRPYNPPAAPMRSYNPPPRDYGRPAYQAPRSNGGEQRHAEPAPRKEPPPRKDDEQH